MFAWDDKQTARKVLAAYAAEVAYRATLKALDEHEGSSDEFLGDEALPYMREAFEIEPGDEAWRDKPNGATCHLVFWAWNLVNENRDEARQDHKDLMRSLANGGEYAFRLSRKESMRND